MKDTSPFEGTEMLNSGAAQALECDAGMTDMNYDANTNASRIESPHNPL